MKFLERKSQISFCNRMESAGVGKFDCACCRATPLVEHTDKHFMKKRYTLMLATMIALAGCATAPKMDRLSIGMTKQEVLSVMGRPDSTSAPGDGIELLHYKLSPQGGPIMNIITEDYFVKTVNGKVVSYGKLRELDNTNAKQEADDKK